MSLPAGSSYVGQRKDEENELVQCPYCSSARLFKGQRGLNVHIGKSHKNLSQSVHLDVAGPSQAPFHTVSSKPFWQILSALKSSTPVVKRIPRGARITVAQHLSTKIQKAISDNSVCAWEQLLLFTYQILHSKNNKLSLTTTIKNNCLNHTNSNQIHSNTLDNSFGRYSNKNKYKENSRWLLNKIETKVSDGDLKGAAQLLFSNDVVAPDTSDTLTALIEKHPPSLSPLLLPSISSQSTHDNLQATTKDVKNAILSFKNGSAGGLDGLTPQHIKDLVFGCAGDASETLLKDITDLINFMLKGKVHEQIAPLLYGANLCALKKKDGGVRPIAIGSTYRRIASKVCCKYILPKLTNKFQPLQLGFGSKGGCEAAVHALRSFIHNNGGEVVLKVDVKNAFNSVDRTILLTEIQNCIPEIFNYLWQCYGLNSKLVYKDHLIDSCTGCQQGDPLGPAIFSLAIHSIITSLNSKFNIWYLDDGTLGGEANTVLKDLKFLIQKFREIGLDLNSSKCELFITDLVKNDNRDNIIHDFNQLAPNLKILNSQNLRLLGAPILDQSFPNFIEEQRKKFDENSQRLTEIHSHVAFHIIRFCLFVPKLTYVLRCCPFWKCTDLLFGLDTTIKNILIQILNTALSDNSWCQASLPIRFGGIGIRKISSVSLPAFLSSVHSTHELYSKIMNNSGIHTQIVCMEEAKVAWNSACPGESLPKNPRSQKQWDEPLCKIVQNDLQNIFSDPKDKARLLATSERESGYWLQVIPSANIGTFIDNTSFSISVGLRLGISITEPHLCRCGREVDRKGLHGLCCARSAGRLSRHAALNDVIRRALVTVNVPAILEPNGISRDDGKRPDGMTLIPWSRGKPLVWDATCADTLAASHVPATSRAAGAAANMAESLKRRKYASLGENYIFLPFGVETMGPWGSEAKKLIKEISKRLIDKTGDPRAGSYLHQRISLAIQRGNVASFLGTLPAGSELNSVFYL